MLAMKKLLGFTLFTAVCLITLAIIALLTFRFWGGSLPTRVKLYLPDPLLVQITTPIPTALPAPAVVAEAKIAPLILPTYTATAISPQPSAVSVQPSALSAQPATAIPTPTETATPTATPLPAQARIENIEILPQKFNNCGPANLTINLNHYGLDADQLDITATIKPHYDDRNVSPWELVSYVNSQTPLKAKLFHGGNLAILKRLLSAGYPVIIEKGLDHDGWMGHYLTLVGYDDSEQTFLSLDTFLGPWDSSGLAESYDFIEEYWQHFNYTFLLVYPPEQDPFVAQILGDPYLDELQMWQNTAVRAQNAIKETPENAFAWFNLGSSLTHLAQLTDDPTHAANAAIAFDQARTIGLPWRMLWYQFEPYEAYLQNGRTEDVIQLADAMLQNGGGMFVEETYLYKGLALQQMGEDARATAVFKRGLEINPNHELLLTANNQE